MSTNRICPNCHKQEDIRFNFGGNIAAENDFHRQDWCHCVKKDAKAKGLISKAISATVQSINRNNDYHNTSKLAEGIMTKEQIRKDLDVLDGMKDKEIQEAIMILQQIKGAYAKACLQIDTQANQTFFDFCSKGQAIRPDIVWDKANEMKRNALDWNKVNELLQEVLSDDNIKKIRICEDSNRKNRFIELAEWLKSHSTSKQMIKRALKQFYGKQTKSKEFVKIRNEYAWYNKPLSWDSFAEWLPWVWVIGNRQYPQSMIIMFPFQIIRGVFFGIYRLVAFLVKSIDKLCNSECNTQDKEMQEQEKKHNTKIVQEIIADIISKRTPT